MKTKNNSIVKAADFSAVQFSPVDVVNQITLIQELMRLVMKEGEHFGKIPGCGDKPVLLKSGAEKLAFMFRLAPTYEIKVHDLQNNHREYEVITTLTHIPSGRIVSQGVGFCSTMESKFRYRWQNTNLKLSKIEADKLKAAGKGKWSKIGNEWIWQEKIENDNIVDTFNTILKMAKKRSLVDAILSSTAASDIFNQDLEEMQPDVNSSAEISSPRNYTSEIEAINDLDELKNYYEKLNDIEKKNLMSALKFRKEQLLQNS